MSNKFKVRYKVVVACGMADYNKDTDNSLREVFVRADELMYKNKEELKKTC